MKKKWEVRYFVTAVASVPVYKAYSKTETYRQAAKDGWGTVYRDEENNLVCDDDCSASLYTKNGGYFGIFPYEEINTKEMPKQAACAAIITSDSCGYTFWAEDFNQIHIFVTYEESGLIDTFRVEYGEDAQPYDGETEISFEDLTEAEAWERAYRAELPGTVEYHFKQEADALVQEAGETWMDAEQREQFRQVCGKIDRIGSAWQFKCTMQLLAYDYNKKIINAARKFKQCFNSAQYEPEAPSARAVVFMAAEIMEEDSQQEAGTAAEAASEGQETALGTPDNMAGNGCHGSGRGASSPAAGRGNQPGEADCNVKTESRGRLTGAETRTALMGAGPEKKGGEKDMACYTTRTYEERVTIQTMWEAGAKATEIADKLAAPLSSIYAELRRGQDGSRLQNQRLRYSADLALSSIQKSYERRGRRAGKRLEQKGADGA